MAFVAHPELHPVMEVLAYAVSYALYKQSRKATGDALPDEQRWVVIAAAAIGALIGARILGVLEQVPRDGLHVTAFLAPGGKTIVGGLLGGWISVEAAKIVLKIKTRTGDLFAIPLCVGIAIGRVGCFFAGLPDDTYGTATKLPWGVNFGDGIRRHPTQLYEVIFLVALAMFLGWSARKPHAEGSLFRIFLGSYLAWRVFIDMFKPQPVVGMLNMIQWASIIGLIALGIASLLSGEKKERDEAFVGE